MTDPAKIRQLRENALRQASTAVADAAFLRLIEMLPEEAPGTVEHEFWRTIFAFEEMLREERGKTVRLSRTRQKLGRAGVMKTLEDFATSKTPSGGFNMLMDRGHPELTGEAVILRHAQRFDDRVVESARTRLVAAGVDIDSLPKK